MKPIIAITAGDPAGIGPEIVVKALRSPEVLSRCRPLVIGELGALRAAGFKRGMAPVLGIPASGGVEAGRIRASHGQAGFKAVRLALRLIQRGRVSALVTAPVSKQAWQKAKIPFKGHTEFFQSELKLSRLAMMFMGKASSGPTLRASLVTGHFPLSLVSGHLSIRSVLETALLTEEALRIRLGILRPRIGLCAFNPHAGERGLLGWEEIRILKPSLARLKKISKSRWEGPWPADWAWQSHVQGNLDALICLYHDQALMPLKTAAQSRLVHWTLGLPFVRTSPAHGTAFDIAGQGRADPSSMIEAILLASRLAQKVRGSGIRDWEVFYE